MSPNKVIIVTTSHFSLGSTAERTGVWVGSLAAAYFALLNAGFVVDIASIKGGAIPIDQRSLQARGSNTPEVERFMNDKRAQLASACSLPLRAVDPNMYRAVVLPGGHGCLWDHPGNIELNELLLTILASGGVVAALCHGVAGLLKSDSVTTDNQNEILAHRSLTTFSLQEERIIGLDTLVPFILETQLRCVAASVKVGPAFQPLVVQDRNLITGQNPSSAWGVMNALLAILQVRGAGPQTTSKRAA